MSCYFRIWILSPSKFGACHSLKSPPPTPPTHTQFHLDDMIGRQVRHHHHGGSEHSHVLMPLPHLTSWTFWLSQEKGQKLPEQQRARHFWAGCKTAVLQLALQWLSPTEISGTCFQIPWSRNSFSSEQLVSYACKLKWLFNQLKCMWIIT